MAVKKKKRAPPKRTPTKPTPKKRAPPKRTPTKPTPKKRAPTKRKPPSAAKVKAAAAARKRKAVALAREKELSRRAAKGWETRRRLAEELRKAEAKARRETAKRERYELEQKQKRREARARAQAARDALEYTVGPKLERFLHLREANTRGTQEAYRAWYKAKDVARDAIGDEAFRRIIERLAEVIGFDADLIDGLSES